MTKLWLMSDLHRDYAEWHPPAFVPDADVCVVAGDVGERLLKSLAWLRDTLAPLMPVVYVAGNHDFYREGVVEARREAREHAADYPGVHFLDDSAVVLGGVRFVGATLWTDFALNGNQASGMSYAGARMNDYKRVKFSKVPFERFTPTRSCGLHHASRRYLDETLSQPFDGPTVVVTHHAPHRDSLDPRRPAADRYVDPAYATDMSETMLKHGPDLWLHGHVHVCNDYTVGSTRVVSNPRGYGNENPGFVPGLVLEVGK